MKTSRSPSHASSPSPWRLPGRPSKQRRIPRYYIKCERDRAIPIALQREMQKESPCRQKFSIDADHSPFFSAPDKLADILSRIGTA
jgi:pimeloyl-ACP methyl ester carboxylesterase